MRYYDNGNRKNEIVMKQIVIDGEILPNIGNNCQIASALYTLFLFKQALTKKLKIINCDIHAVEIRDTPNVCMPWFCKDIR